MEIFSAPVERFLFCVPGSVSRGFVFIYRNQYVECLCRELRRGSGTVRPGAGRDYEGFSDRPASDLFFLAPGCADLLS